MNSELRTLGLEKNEDRRAKLQISLCVYACVRAYVRVDMCVSAIPWSRIVEKVEDEGDSKGVSRIWKSVEPEPLISCLQG